MIKMGQSDITSQGYLFSMVVILLINLLLIEWFLIGVMEHYTFKLWGLDVWHRLTITYQFTGQELMTLAQWCWQELGQGVVTIRRWCS
jgi:hypothetical protein